MSHKNKVNVTATTTKVISGRACPTDVVTTVCPSPTAVCPTDVVTPTTQVLDTRTLLNICAAGLAGTNPFLNPFLGAGIPGLTNIPGVTGIPGLTGIPGVTGVPGLTGLPGLGTGITPTAGALPGAVNPLTNPLLNPLATQAINPFIANPLAAGAVNPFLANPLAAGVANPFAVNPFLNFAAGIAPTLANPLTNVCLAGGFVPAFGAGLGAAGIGGIGAI